MSRTARRVSQHCPEQREEYLSTVHPEQQGEYLNAFTDIAGEYLNIVQNSEENIVTLSSAARRVSQLVQNSEESIQICPEQQGEYLRVVQNSEESIKTWYRTARRVSQGCPEQ